MEAVHRVLSERFLKPVSQLQWIEILMSMVVGALGGLLPIPGVSIPTTLFMCRLCSFSAAEVALASTANLLCTPLQLLMMPIWGRGIAALAGKDTSLFTLTHIKNSMQEGMKALFVACSDIILFGALGWMCTAVIIVFAVHIIKPNLSPQRRKQE